MEISASSRLAAGAQVASNRVHSYVLSGGGTGDARLIDAWACAHGRAVGVGRSRLYDLSSVVAAP